MNLMNMAASESIPTLNAEFSEPLSVETVPVITRWARIALRWRWVIIGVIAASVILGLIVTLLTTPIYIATNTLEIAREGDKVVKVGGVEQEVNASDQEFYQTQYGLLKSKSLAERVARSLRLADNPGFFKLYGQDMDSIGQRGVAGRAARERRAGEILAANIDIAPVRLSRLVAINFVSSDAAFSATVANSWASNFIQSNLERRYDSTAYARKFLEDRLADLRTRLETTERQLVAYAQAQRIINIPSASSNRDQPAIERPAEADELSALNAELASATADRIRAESRLSTASATPEAFNNQAIGQLRQRRAELSADYAKLTAQFEPGYPPAKALASQIASLDRNIGREEGRARDILRTGYAESTRREGELKSRVSGLQSGLLDLRKRSIQYNIYQRDVDTTRELYDGLLQRYKEIGVAGGVGSNNISVVDPAKVPESPSKPRLIVNLAIALLFGSALAAGIAFALEQIDESLTDPGEVERRIGLPLLGAIPKLDGSQTPLEALADRKSQMIDAYLAVQTNLGFTTSHGVPRTLSVTSTRPAEGKSTTALALATALHRSGRRTLLIDGDMRSPSIHRTTGLSNEHGLSNYLSGANDLAPLINRGVSLGIDIMTAGPTPPNAAELLVTDRLSELLQRLQSEYDCIVVDAPPVMGLADAPLIASQTEAAVFVVESHAIRARLVRTALSRLSNTSAHVIGVILTKFESSRAHFGYGYDYGYGYGAQKDAN